MWANNWQNLEASAFFFYFVFLSVIIWTWLLNPSCLRTLSHARTHTRTHARTYTHRWIYSRVMSSDVSTLPICGERASGCCTWLCCERAGAARLWQLWHLRTPHLIFISAALLFLFGTAHLIDHDTSTASRLLSVSRLLLKMLAKHVPAFESSPVLSRIPLILRFLSLSTRPPLLPLHLLLSALSVYYSLPCGSVPFSCKSVL